MIDASIVGGLKPFQIESPVDNYSKILTLQNLMRQQQVGDMELQDRQQAQASDKTLASLWASGQNPEQIASGLAGAGYGKQAMAFIKAQQDAAEAKAKTLHFNAQSGKLQGETLDGAMQRHRDGLASVETPEQAAQWVNQGYADPALAQISKYGNVQQSLQAIPQDPAAFGQWKMQNMLKGDQLIKQLFPDANARLQSGTSMSNNTNTVNATVRGQDLRDARDDKTASKNPPSYMWGPNGPDGAPTQFAVKGGPADLKIAGALNQDTQALTGAISGLDRLSVAANEVLNHPGLKGISGLRGALPNIPGTNAADAQALLGTLKSQVGFGVLQDMRNNSKTGGALGAVSDKENAMLQANLAALDKSQSIEQFQANLQKVIAYTDGAKDRMREAYNLKHGPESVNPVRPGSNPTPTPPVKPTPTAAPKTGAVEGGYKFIGGDPSKPSSWQKVGS